MPHVPYPIATDIIRIASTYSVRGIRKCVGDAIQIRLFVRVKRVDLAAWNAMFEGYSGKFTTKLSLFRFLC